ncbi:hypothetical protein C0584_01555 [Candidatus Parcubacteria bacterium]|nr:MAG: hypothetical protein C0584_01555 [Candidatus Parcubacteria bacterium]
MFKKHFLAPLTIVFFSFFVSLFLFAPVSFKNVALALNLADYNKSPGDQLTNNDWNRLSDDFVAKSGDTMTGPLLLPSSTPSSSNEAVSKDYVDNMALVLGPSGDQYKMYCDHGPVGGWTSYGTAGSATVATVVDSSASGFSSVIRYFVSLTGSNVAPTLGQNTIYNMTSNSFELHIVYADWHGEFNPFTGDQANTWGWQVHWCAVGY